MSNRAGYQPLSQSVEEADVGEGVQPSPATQRLARRLRRAPRPGNIDLSKLDNAFKRWAL
jgi:phosphatidylinositol 4-kinase type 2